MIIWDPLWSTMTQNIPNMSGATMTQNLVNHSILTQNKVELLFIFLNLVLKTSFQSNFYLKTFKYFVLIQTRFIVAFNDAESQFHNCFYKLSPQDIVLGKIWSWNFNVLFLKWNLVYWLFKRADSEFGQI